MTGKTIISSLKRYMSCYHYQFSVLPSSSHTMTMKVSHLCTLHHFFTIFSLYICLWSLPCVVMPFFALACSSICHTTGQYACWFCLILSCTHYCCTLPAHIPQYQLISNIYQKQASIIPDMDALSLIVSQVTITWA